MQILLKIIAVCFAGFAVLQLDDPDSARWFSIYAAGGLVTAASLKNNLPRTLVRLCAVGAMVFMFFYFFGFFRIVPQLGATWWNTEVGGEALGLLFGAFSMCLVVAQFSCRLKANQPFPGRRSPAVFSAPPNR